MSQNNLVVARRYFIEIMNMADMAALDELLAPDFVFTLATHPEPYHGPEGFKELVSMLHGAFPDFYINVQDMVASGDTVVTRWRGGGTHVGGILKTVQGDVAATGKSFEIDGMTWHRIVDGKIVEALANEDTVGLMTQLGVLPGPTPDSFAETHNAKLAERYFNELMNQGKVEIIPELFDPNCSFIIPTQPRPVYGHDGLAGFVTYLRSAFPDIRFAVERQIVDKNKVAARWKITGTHHGEFLGAQPTGRFVEDYGIDIFTISQGKILSIHVNENDFGLMRQIGIIPS